MELLWLLCCSLPLCFATVTAKPRQNVVTGIKLTDELPCEDYNPATTAATCGGVEVHAYAILCGSGFNRTACSATAPAPNGGKTTIYFKGTPPGLPAGHIIRSDCSESQFPEYGGIAMAQTFATASGKPDGCKPIATVQGATMTYTTRSPSSSSGSGSGSAAANLASITINFGPVGGSFGYVRVMCEPGGPAEDFHFTVGEDTPSGAHGIVTTADCTIAPLGFWCFEGEFCTFGPQPRGAPGGTLLQCKDHCGPTGGLYSCNSDRCVRVVSGGRSLAACQSKCGHAALNHSK